MTDDTDHDDPVELYDDLVMAGERPDPVEFSKQFPEYPNLLKEIRKLDELRGELDELGRVSAGRSSGWPEEIGGLRVREPLGQGGMGVVFEAEAMEDGSRVAVKMLKHESTTASKRFAREADLAKSLDHPGIARVTNYGVEDGVAFLASELIDGFSLREMIKAREAARHRRQAERTDRSRFFGRDDETPKAPASPRGVVAVGLQIAQALGYAHNKGVVHRDIKPSNVMVSLQGKVKLIDFGIARAMHESERITHTGIFIGSHDYAAPEQILGQLHRIGPWTDTYALGATLYEMLTGNPAFGLSLAQRRAKPESMPKPLRQVVAETPKDLEKLIKKAMDPREKKRFQNGEELAKALAKWLKKN